MGGSASKVSAENAVRAQEVDQTLVQQQLNDLFKSKVLLLGAGESGKSTVVKQLRLIHEQPFRDFELALAKDSLHQNIVDCMKSLISTSKKFEYYEVNTEDEQLEKFLFEYPKPDDKLTPDIAKQILNLYHQPCIQKTYERKAEFWILDAFPYYIKNLERICQPDFQPTQEDCVMARIRTTGITVSELDHTINEKQDPDEPDVFRFQVVDVGGQRNERKKWMHCFDDVKAILFVVNLGAYNQVLFEDQNKNRLTEELELFKQIVRNETFKDTPIFLFLNKKDLFEPMITEVDMQKLFPNYKGGNNVENGLQFIADQFLQHAPKDKIVYVQVVSAKSEADIAAAFEQVKQTLYEFNKEQLLQKAQQIKSQLGRSSISQQTKKSKTFGCFG